MYLNGITTRWLLARGRPLEISPAGRALIDSYRSPRMERPKYCLLLIEETPCSHEFEEESLRKHASGCPEGSEALEQRAV